MRLSRGIISVWRKIWVQAARATALARNGSDPAAGGRGARQKRKTLRRLSALDAMSIARCNSIPRTYDISARLAPKCPWAVADDSLSEQTRHRVMRILPKIRTALDAWTHSRRPAFIVGESNLRFPFTRCVTPGIYISHNGMKVAIVRISAMPELVKVT